MILFSILYRDSRNRSRIRLFIVRANNADEARSIAFGVLLEDMKDRNLDWFEIMSVDVAKSSCAPSDDVLKGGESND